MQPRFLNGLRDRSAVRPGTVMVLCVAALGVAPQARAQLVVRVGPVGVSASGTLARVVTDVGAVVRAVEPEPGRAKPGRGAGGGTDAREPAAGAPVGSAARVLPTAERYLGVPYRWGGTSPTSGFDCSGFVQYVFARHGTHLPRTSREMASAGRVLRPVWAALRPGDLVLFAERGARISHVAIYAGRRRIIHATSSGRRVRYDALDTRRGRWFAERLVAARRVSPRGPAVVRELLAEWSLQERALRPTLDAPDRAPRPDGDF